MESLDYWRLCDELSVIQAALLIVGEDPTAWQDSEDGLASGNRPVGYDAALTWLTNAILSERLRATIRNEIHQSVDPIAECVVDYESDEPDWHKTTVMVDDLRTSLTGRGFRTGFFFPTATDAPDYLDPDHPRYALKLAAAVNAWLAMGDETATRGKSAKQALVKWLRENAATYKLSDQEGKPNETGIEECAKVANWQDKGGAPKTPDG